MRLLIAIGALVCALPTQAPPSRLLIAFASFRDRPLHPRVYFYETDGRGDGKLVGGVPAADLRSDTHPTLSLDGRRCAFASEQENQHGETRLWDLSAKQEIAAPAELNTEAPEIGGCLSGDGKWIAFAARNRQGAPAGWNLFLFDLASGKTVELPNLNSDEDEQAPSLSQDAGLLAFVSNRREGGGAAGAHASGRSHVYLYDRQAQALLPLPGLISARRDAEPARSADGRFLAFSSDRSGGAGSRDLYLYDLAGRRFLPLPGVNTPGPEQSPSLSADGRYLAFVAERVSGLGERDVYLYDRQSASLVPLPGLNSKAEDFDPAVVGLK